MVAPLGTAARGLSLYGVTCAANLDALLSCLINSTALPGATAAFLSL